MQILKAVKQHRSQRFSLYSFDNSWMTAERESAISRWQGALLDVNKWRNNNKKKCTLTFLTCLLFVHIIPEWEIHYKYRHNNMKICCALHFSLDLLPRLFNCRYSISFSNRMRHRDFPCRMSIPITRIPFRNNMPASCKGNRCKPKQTFHPHPHPHPHPTPLLCCHSSYATCNGTDDWQRRLTLCARSSNPRRAIYSPSRANTATVAATVRLCTVSSSVLRFIPCTHALLKSGNLLSRNQLVLWCNG